MNGLHHTVTDYLALRRSLGFKLARHRRLLPQLADYLESVGATTVTTRLALAWATSLDGKPDEWAIRLSIARGFAGYLATLDPATEVPPAGLLPRRSRRADPYPYSDGEIAALMAATDTLRFPLRAATYRTLIGLWAVTGMRVGETIGLDRTDLDRVERTLLVKNAKFGDTRLLPLHPSTVGALAGYAELRDRHRPQPTSPAFFISTAGTRLHYTNVNRTFHALARAAGLNARSATCRPRIHDLRHRLVIVTLLDWYRGGVDVAARLPALSAYLGHSCPAFTFWYYSDSRVIPMSAPLRG
jgi:integrase/recombinase XerD